MDKHILPVVTLKGLVVYPGNVVTFDVGREQSIKSVERAVQYDTEIFLVAQKKHEIENPKFEDLYKVGTVCKIKQIMRFSEDRVRVLVEGHYRARLYDVTHMTPFIEGIVAQIKSNREYVETEIDEAIVRSLIEKFEEYSALNTKALIDVRGLVAKFGSDVDTLTFEIANILPIPYETKQDLLEEDDSYKRAEDLIGVLIREIEILNIEREINIKVQKQIGKIQRTSYLKEQIKVIKAELGEGDSLEKDVQEYREKAMELDLPDEVFDKVNSEIDRLSLLSPSAPEVAVIMNYLDLVLSLPWNTRTEETIDLNEAKRILNEDHYGLAKVKERIIEYLAVRKLNDSQKGPIICLVGPPGVGKTSIAKSIARALNRKYVRMSLGGLKDESEIRGHRKTYVGAMCGRIINAIKQAESKNPLILLDEIDKMGTGFRGDPAAAMLEVLDPEQNSTFRDNYLELPFDLSEVLFMTTANSLDTIPRPLLDRMEIIEVSSYTEEEKVQIAKLYLIPKQLEANGLKGKRVVFRQDAIRDIISCYTAEAGVRNLEREIGKVCRKIAIEFATGNRKSFTVTVNNLESLLGVKKRIPNKITEKDEIGVATGLAWTSIGGVTLNIEVNVMPGKGKLELTGRLGDVMKESAVAAISYIRSKQEELGIDKDFMNNNDIHVHIPEGATPKDGPSAGITLATAMISAILQVPVKKSVAMTGEVTIRGRVLAIGGLKEKALAAHRQGINTVIIPEDNIKDLEEIPEEVRKEINFVPVSNMDKVLKTALVDFKFVKKDTVVNQAILDNDSSNYAHI